MEQNEHQDSIEALILASLQQELEAEERLILEAWIRKSPENKAYFDRQVAVWTAAALADTSYRYDPDKAFDRFCRQTGVQRRKKIPAGRFFRIAYRVAAAAAAVLLIAYFSFQSGSMMMEKQFADIVVEAPLGSKSKMYLPDGTLVWLNAGSRIAYSQGFGVKDRRVELSGEAYFEVARNEQLPFDVNTHDLKLEVLGTKFNFRNYPDDAEAVVELLEGKVQVENRLREMPPEFLAVNERVVLDKHSGEMQKLSSKARRAKEWTDNILFFDEEPLRKIAKELERAYGVQIRVENPALLEKRFYGYFDTQEQRVEEVLGILAETGYFRYFRDEQKMFVIQ